MYNCATYMQGFMQYVNEKSIINQCAQTCCKMYIPTVTKCYTRKEHITIYLLIQRDFQYQ